MENHLYVYLAILLVVTVVGITVVTEHQPKSYMDEEFHVKQAQGYCNGSFSEWDPKITTLPGLYLFSVGILQPISYVTGLHIKEGCSIPMLRLINSLFAVANLYVMYAISKRLHKNANEKYWADKAMVLSLMPVLFFFNMLFYTDPGSLFFILYAYYFHLNRSYALSSLLGLISIVFRQTNIIWIFFMGLSNVVRNFLRQQNLEKGEKHTAGSVLTKSLPMFLVNTLFNCWSYAIVGGIALTFIIINEGIVVGDREAHTLCFHPAQFGYFACFTLLLGLPHLVTQDKLDRFMRFVMNHKLSVFLFACNFAFCIHLFTHEHIYLLSDNRHLTFYVWSKFFRRYFFFRYGLIPVYIYALWSIDDSLSHLHHLIRVCFWICVAIATVPQKLLEFRYFVVPFILTRLHMKDETPHTLLIETLIYIALNAATLYIFLFMPIFWEGQADPQRIMW